MGRKTGNWFAFVAGIGLLIGGLAWGLIGSHQVGYENSQQDGTYHIGTGTSSDNVYIHADGSDEYFVAFSGDFSPAISQDDIDNSAGLSFVARTDTSDIDLDVNGTTINQAHKIEKLVFVDKNGSTMATYTTAEYNANPNGVYVSEWSDAGWLAGFGLIVAIAALIQVLRPPKTNFSIGTASVPSYPPVPPAYPPVQPGVPYPPAQPGAYPPVQPGAPYPPTDPYGQPYQNPGQYPPAQPYQ